MFITSSPRSLKALGLIIVCFLLLGTIRYHEVACRTGYFDICSSKSQSAEIPFSTTSFKHRNIAIATSFALHFDVWLPLAWTLERVTRGVEGSVIQAYAQTPFAHGFAQISDELGLYHGTVKDYQAIISDLRTNGGDGGIDMIILATSFFDLRHYGKDLVDAWDSRDVVHKFTVVGIVHHTEMKGWEELFAPLARRGALRLLTLSNHVSRSLEGLLSEYAASRDPIFRSAGFEHVRSDFHVPVLNISTPDKIYPRRLSNAVIQGTFDQSLRDFSPVFKDLAKSLSDDPHLWGYRTSHDSPSLVEDEDLSDPFKLHLVGHGGDLGIPQELENVIVYHRDLDYREFYDTMASMDICLPAFNPDYGYYTATASSTVVMCSQVNTPMLVTKRFRDAYKYLDDERILITHPAVMSEVEAIKALRTQDASDFLSSDPSNSGFSMGSYAAVRDAIERMIGQGWIRPKPGFDEWKQNVWASNDAVITRILNGL